MKFDAIVIGSGQAGNPLSQRFADLGWKVALIERGNLGGTCINTGCTPTKTMVASAQVAHYARNAAKWGVHADNVNVDLPFIVTRKRKVVESFRDGQQRRVDQRPNLQLFRGHAQFISSQQIQVGNDILESERIFINTGTRPEIPKISGMEAVPCLTNASIMELHELPKHLLVLGGGYIGLEFGQMFRRFGSRVTIVQSGAQLLRGEDEDVAEAVLSILRGESLDVLLNSRAVRVAKSVNGIELMVQTAGKAGETMGVSAESQTIFGTHLLFAAGRVPNSDSLNTAAAGISRDKHGYVQVNDRLETNVPGVFALGDIKGGPAFTHISYDDFRIIRTNVIEKGSASIAGRLLPYTLFIDPQLGRVGMSEGEARASGRKIRIAKMPMNYVARALELDESRGFMKAIVDSDSNQILGAAVLGIEGGEVMSQLQLAMMGKLPYTTLKDGVFAHPTLAESLNNLFAHFADE